MTSSRTDLTEVRANWKRMPATAQATFLFEMFTMLYGERLAVVPVKAGSAVNWRAMKDLIATTPAKQRILVGSALSIFSLLAGLALFFFVSPWWLALGLYAVIFYWAVFKKPFSATRDGIVEAAFHSVEVFDQLWWMGAFALERPNEKLVYSAHPNGDRWQDVVLLSMGWDDAVQEQPLDRTQGMQNILRDIDAAKQQAR